MNFSDSDWTSEGAASTSGRRDGNWTWALLLGIVIGAAGATLAFLMLDHLSPQDAPRPLAAVSPGAPAAVPPPAKAPAALVESAPPRAGPAEAPTAASATTPVIESGPAIVPATSASTTRPLGADELRRKERAWAAHYKRPAACDGNPTTDQLIECANHFIRSKRDFDERWKTAPSDR